VSFQKSLRRSAETPLRCPGGEVASNGRVAQIISGGGRALGERPREPCCSKITGKTGLVRSLALPVNVPTGMSALRCSAGFPAGRWGDLHTFSLALGGTSRPAVEEPHQQAGVAVPEQRAGFSPEVPGGPLDSESADQWQR